jgi:23S rRNA (adenine2503-C2)-methyltransferase
VPKIYELADLDLQITLSISLHAADNEARSEIMPINKKYSISELLKACDYYAKKTNKRISFEYTVIPGVNDSLDDARKLSKLLRGSLSHVNLIGLNKVVESGFNSPSQKEVYSFAKVLQDLGVNATVRRRLGADIDAACGQLRNKSLENGDGKLE